MSGHIKPEHSLALMALPPDDAERMVAEQHAEGCPACRALLGQGDTMLSWLDALPYEEPVPSALKARVRSALPEPRRSVGGVLHWLALALLAAGSLLLAWLEATPGGPASALAGLECAAFEQAVAVGPFALAALLALRGKVALEPLSMAATTMAGALAGQLLLHARCAAPEGGLLHQLAFHTAGVLLAAVLGYVGSRFVLPTPSLGD